MSKVRPDETERFVNQIQQYFLQLHRKYKALLCLMVPGVVLLGLTFSGILEFLLYLPAAVKVFLILLLGALSVSSVLFLRKKLAPPTFKQFYRQLSREYQMPELGNALDLYGASSSQKTDLYKAAIQQNIDRLDYQKTQKALASYTRNHRITHLFNYSSVATAAILLAFVGFSVIQTSAINRFIHFWENYSPPNPYTYSVEPGSIVLEQGESFVPQITFKDHKPEDLTLAFKTEIETQFRTRNSTTTDNKQASFAPISFSTDGSYYFKMDGFRSMEFPITVQLRPRFEQLSVQIIPPEYTGMDTARHTYPFAKLSPYYGSEVILSGITNKAVSDVILLHKDKKDSVALVKSETDSIYRHSWMVTSSDSLAFTMFDSSGLSNNNRFPFTIEPVEDQIPSIALLEPAEDQQLQSPENIQLRYEASDDFGLTEASLHFEIQRAFSDNIENKILELPAPPLNQEQHYDWNLPELDLQPRDIITYWIEVKDNDGYNGPKAGRSQKRTITITSMTEYLSELESQEQEVEKSLDDISDSFEQMQQEYEQFKEQLVQEPEDSWSQQQELQQVEQQRQKIEEKVNELNKNFEELRKDIEKNQSMAPETMDTYEELQKLMKDINDPEFSKALEELQEAMDQVDQEEMRKALDNYEFNEEMYRERIERTKELFKSLKLNSELEKMAAALEKLAEMEQEISQSNAPGEDLKRQNAVREDLEKLQEQLSGLEENVPQKARQQVEALQQDAHQQFEQIKKEIASNIEQLKQQNEGQSDPKIQQQQQDIQQQLQQMSSQMRNTKQQLNQQQKRINGAALQYILYSLLNLSDNQEELTKETESLPARSQAFVEKARQEQNISRQFSMLSDSLYRVSSEIPSFSNQINERKQQVEEQLTRTVEILSERDKANAVFAQKQSLGGINEIASMVANLLEQLQNQQGGSGGGMSMEQLMEQMQQMSGQQQKLNQEIQNMINDMQGDRLSRDQTERLKQLSRQQNTIRRQMRELQQEGDLDSGDRILSELERMSEEMENAINDIRGGQLDRQLMQRQQNILSRMLSAEEAVQKRGEDDQRQATTAEDHPESASPDITLEELQQKVRKMLNDPDRSRFSEDYQQLIEQYFEILKEQQIKLEEQ